MTRLCHTRPVPITTDEIPIARRLTRAVVWLLLLLAGLLAWATVVRVTDGGGPSVDRLGTATVVSCAGHGPVSQYGLGTTYRCIADVRWSNGETEREEFPPGQLSLADIGHPVPVYLEIPDGTRGHLVLGRNDTARYSAIALPVTLGLGFVVIALGIGALHAGFRVFRPRSSEQPREIRTRGAEQRKAAERENRRWPVSPEDREAAGIPKITWRLRLLAAWCVLAVLYAVLATIPRFDAPHALQFVSPWPQIERALLVDMPTAAFVVLGLILALLLAAMAGASRTDAARVVRYGTAFLMRHIKGSADAQLHELAKRQRGQRVIAYAVGAAFLALAVWAAIRAGRAAPSSGPVLVWLACLRDAVLFTALGAIWLSTFETRYQRLERLLRRHKEIDSATAGTVPSKTTS